MKTKTLIFEGTEEHEEIFTLLHQGFLFGQPEGGLRGIGPRRTAVRLLEHFEAISEPVEDDGKPLRFKATGDEVRKLVGGGGTMELEGNEFDMLRSHFEAYMPHFNTGFSRQVIAAYEMLEAAKSAG